MIDHRSEHSQHNLTAVATTTATTEAKKYSISQ